jgi:hypothetical protein
MKREDVLAILENAEIDNSAKLQAILDLNGTDVNSKNKRIKELEDAAEGRETAFETERQKYKDYESILQERDALKAEKEEKAFCDRFNSVLGNNKPKNEFTRKGLIDLFRAEVAKDENKGKEDADIFATLVKDHEAEYFESKVRFNMTPSNPNIKQPTSTEAYLNEIYKDNPFYKQQTN